jgi:hypothetical protein
MFLKRIGAFGFLFALAGISDAQTPNINNNVRAGNLLNRMSTNRLSPGDMNLPIVSSIPTGIIGDTYLDSHWAKSSLLLYEREDLVDSYLARFDIKNNEFEFLIDNGVRVLPGNKVKNVLWIDSLTQQSRFLINAKDYVSDGVPLLGFFEVSEEGTYQLLKKAYLEILRPDFSPALNVGSKDYKILKKQEFYYSIGNQVYLIKNKSSFEPLQAAYPPLREILKNGSYNFKREADLVKLFASLKGS